MKNWISTMSDNGNKIQTLTAEQALSGIFKQVPDNSENSSLAGTLEQRGNRYGSFDSHAAISQYLKTSIEQAPSRTALTPAMVEALEMIFHKVARILNGDPTYADSWHDIAGYATLVEKELDKENKEE